MKVRQETIGSRLGKARREIGLNVCDFSRVTSIPVSTLKKYESDHSTPGGQAIQLIVKAGINAHWLLTNERQMLIEDTGYKTNSYNNSILSYEDTVQGHSSNVKLYPESATIPQFDVSFPPGLGQYPEDHPLTINNRTFSIQWLNKKGLQPDKLVLVRVQGDSYGTIT